MEQLEFPNDWQSATVADLVDPGRPITYGIVQPGLRLPEGAGIKMIRGQDYSDGRVATSGLYHVHPAVDAPYRRSRVKGGDLLFSIVGYVGLVAEVPETLTGANITQTTARLAIRAGHSARFLLHYLRSRRFRTEVARFTKGSAQPGLNLADVKVMRVGVPSLEEQLRIAEVLDTLDDAIQKTEQVIAKLKQVKQGLLHDLLTCGVDENGELGDPKRHPELFKDSTVGKVPRDWDVAPFASYSPANRPYIKTGPFGSSLKQEHWVPEGVPVITIGSLGEGEFHQQELLHVSEQTAKSLGAYAVAEGDIVFSRVADVGRSVTVSRIEAGWIMSSNMMWIAVDQNRAVPACVQANIAANPYVRAQIRRLVNSAGRDVANAQIMNALHLPWPSKREQEQIARVQLEADSRIRAERSQLSKLHLLKQGLSEDLLTGRVRVTPLLDGDAA